MSKNETCSFTFSKCKTDHLTDPMYLSENGHDISRTDVVKYPSILKMDERMRSLFWVPEEISISQDKKDFKSLPDYQQKIFTETLLRATMLDSIQGRAPSAVLLPICTNPELELAITTWDFFESIHSKSYSYIIKNVYTNPSKIFDELKDISGITDCSTSIAEYYDDLYVYNAKAVLNSQGYDVGYDLYEHKKKLYLCLTAINALEAIRFYSAFAVFFSLGENDLMQGTAKILQMIARDESLHVGLTTYQIDNLPKEDPDYAKIAKESYDEMVKVYNDVVLQEIDWVKYIFKEGSMLGLNESMLSEYIFYLGRQKIRQFGFSEDDIAFPVVKSNPLPWMDSWLNLSATQSAPQEIEQINYRAGAVDLNDSDLGDFDL
jgi:ribonucleoside-diphosphate reductase beta chain